MIKLGEIVGEQQLWVECCAASVRACPCVLPHCRASARVQASYRLALTDDTSYMELAQETRSGRNAASFE